MGVQMRMWMLVALRFAILYGIIVTVGAYAGAGDPYFYVILVGMMMRVRYVEESEEPEVHQMIAELVDKGGIPKPRVGVAEVSIPNAFAFGRSIRHGRICVTRGIQRLLGMAGSYDPTNHLIRCTQPDRKSTRLNSSHWTLSRMPSSA